MITFLHTHRRRADGSIVPPEPRLAAWCDRVNKGEHFRFEHNDIVSLEDGRSFLRLRLARSHEQGLPFRQIALYPYNSHIGVVFCHPDEELLPGSDHCPLSYGDVVDYLQTGQLLDRVPCTPPWGYPMDAFNKPYWDGTNDLHIVHPEKLLAPLYEPDDFILPQGVRTSLRYTMHTSQVAEASVSLCRPTEGMQYLWIMYRLMPLVQPSRELHQRIANHLTGALPRYYAGIILAGEKVIGVPFYQRPE